LWEKFKAQYRAKSIPANIPKISGFEGKEEVKKWCFFMGWKEDREE
jgi:hypothetical protein